MPSYVVILAAPYGDADALEAGSNVLEDPRLTMVAQEEAPKPPGPPGAALVGGDATFVGSKTTIHMEIEGPTVGAAVKEAYQIYDAIRQHAGLEPGAGSEPVAVARKNPLLFLHPRSNTFFAVAERMFNEGNAPYAVIAIQTAFELFMEGAFDYVLQLRSTIELGAAVAQLIRSYNMTDARTRGVWESLTDHRITVPEETWRAYQDHLQRRNDLVHRGEGLSGLDAEASLNAVNALAEEVAKVIRRLQPQARELS